MTHLALTPLDWLIKKDIQVIDEENLEDDWRNKINKSILTETVPQALIIPKSSKELSDVITQSAQHKIPLLLCGNGSKLNWGGLTDSPQWVVSTQKLNHIIDHAVGDLTVTVESGVKLKDLQKMLQPYGQFLPIDPAYSNLATVGGIVATANTGSWRQRYGSVRDLVLGISFVRWDGKIAKAGGKVVKNVAGYDLMKLLTGSYGTLGVITDITFRLYPLNKASKTIVITGNAENITLLGQTLKNTGLSPMAADFLSASVVKILELGEGIGLILQFQSILESVNEQIQQAEKYAESFDLKRQVFSEQSEINLWQQLPNIIQITRTEASITGKIGVISNQAVTVLTQLNKLTQNQGLGMINLKQGIGSIQFDTNTDVQVIKKMRSLCQFHQGYLTLLDAPLEIKQKIEPWGYTNNALTLMQKIKQQFDPHNLLNPRKFLFQ